MTLNYSNSFPNKLNLLQLEKGFKPCSPRSWSRDIKKLYNETCFVTGLTNSKKTKLVSHHLFSKKTHQSLAFSLLNGIVLTEEIHKEFHSLYGLETSIDSFQHYLKIKKSYLIKANEIQRFDFLLDWLDFLELNLKGGL